MSKYSKWDLIKDYETTPSLQCEKKMMEMCTDIRMTCSRGDMEAKEKTCNIRSCIEIDKESKDSADNL